MVSTKKQCRSKPRPRSEAMIESYLIKMVSSFGGLIWKFTSPGTAGVPDRVIMFKGKVYFVELKAEGKKLRLLQQYRKCELQRCDIDVHCLNSVEAIDDFMVRMVSEQL